MPKQERLLRITGDGTPEGTVVEDVTSGERLAGVERIEFACAVGQQPIKARITISGVEVDLITASEVVERIAASDTIHDAAGACEPDYHRGFPASGTCRCGAIKKAVAQ